VFGALLDGRNFAPYRWARGIAYDPTRNRWRRLPPVHLSPNASSIGWTGRELVAWDYELRAATYDPARNRWRALPGLPLEFGECYPDTVVFGRELLANYCGQGALYESRTRTWRRVKDLGGYRHPKTSELAPRWPWLP
jgi:hypothetical protein